MPLYKLTERRMKKRALEDETGITGLKAKLRAMGEDAGDSASEGWSESESDTDDEGESEGEGEGESDEGEGESDEEGSEDEDGDEEDEGEGDIDVDVEGLEESDEEGAGSDGESEASSSSSVFPISLESALTEPIYDSRENPADKLCVLCPDKSMKNAHMVEVHLGSKGHKRAAKRYAQHLTTRAPDPAADPREVVDSILAELDEAPSHVHVPAAPATVAPTGVEGTSVGVPSVEGKRKRPRHSKEERRANKARKLIDELASLPAEKEKGKGNGQGQSNGAAMDGKALNRKARRLLAAHGTASGSKSTSTETKAKVKGQGKGDSKSTPPLKAEAGAKKVDVKVKGSSNKVL